MGRDAITEQPPPPWPTPLHEQFGRTIKTNYRVANRGRSGWQVDRNRRKRFLWWTMGSFPTKKKAEEWIEEAKGKLLRSD